MRATSEVLGPCLLVKDHTQSERKIIIRRNCLGKAMKAQEEKIIVRLQSKNVP